jgi:Ulp1 protease family, C-terminal catalytic domain
VPSNLDHREPPSADKARRREELRQEEIESLYVEKLLSSGHINAAQSLIRALDPEIGGLFCTSLGSSLMFPKANSERWLQIVHDNAGHWLLLAKGFLGEEQIQVSDSMYFTPTDRKHVIACMADLLKTEENNFSYIVKPCQRQTNGFDCGLYSIAFATSLAAGEDPSTIVYDSELLRSHFIECLRQKIIQPFPKSGIRRNSNGTVFTEKVFCFCPRPFLKLSREWEKIRCVGCKNLFHSMCVRNPRNVNKDWKCKFCKIDVCKRKYK